MSSMGGVWIFSGIAQCGRDPECPVWEKLGFMGDLGLFDNLGLPCPLVLLRFGLAVFVYFILFEFMLGLGLATILCSE